MDTDAGPYVTIPAARLAELEAIEAKYKSRNKGRLIMLRERQKANPDTNRKRALDRYHEKRDEINARRRELRRQKREAEAAAATTA